MLRVVDEVLVLEALAYDILRLHGGDPRRRGGGADVGHKGAGQARGIALRVHDDAQGGVAQRQPAVALLIGVEGIALVIGLGIHGKELAALAETQQRGHALHGEHALLHVGHLFVVVLADQRGEIAVVGVNVDDQRIRIHGLDVVDGQLPGRLEGGGCLRVQRGRGAVGVQKRARLQRREGEPLLQSGVRVLGRFGALRRLRGARRKAFDSGGQAGLKRIRQLRFHVGGRGRSGVVIEGIARLGVVALLRVGLIVEGEGLLRVIVRHARLGQAFLRVLGRRALGGGVRRGVLRGGGVLRAARQQGEGERETKQKGKKAMQIVFHDTFLSRGRPPRCPAAARGKSVLLLLYRKTARRKRVFRVLFARRAPDLTAAGKTHIIQVSGKRGWCPWERSALIK